MRNGYLFLSTLLLIALTQSSNASADTTNVTNNYYGNSGANSQDSYGPYGNGAEDFFADTTAANTNDTTVDDDTTTNTVVRGVPPRAAVAAPNPVENVRRATPGRVGVRR